MKLDEVRNFELTERQKMTREMAKDFAASWPRKVTAFMGKRHIARFTP